MVIDVKFKLFVGGAPMGGNQQAPVICLKWDAGKKMLRKNGGFRGIRTGTIQQQQQEREEQKKHPVLLAANMLHCTKVSKMVR